MTAILGIAGGPNMLGGKTYVPGLPPLFFHDSAAALVIDGEVRCAIEEERLSRLKHTNCFPAHAIRACLEETGVDPQDIKRIAYFFGEEFCNADLNRVAAELRHPGPPSIRTIIAENIGKILGFECPPEKIRFVRHHDAHSCAAVQASGFADTLSVVVDGNGERESVTAYYVKRGQQQRLDTIPIAYSPGHFYRQVTRLLGFDDFDEYKVMGLAPYGNPERYRDLLAEACVPRENNQHGVDHRGLALIAHNLGLPARNTNGRFTQLHMDFAAAAQALLERTILDFLTAWRRTSGLRTLCLSGGVAQNCAMNGAIARSGLFRAIYVHPAAHDAGTAIGAALSIANAAAPPRPTQRRFSPFLGRRIDPSGSSEQLAVLQHWRGSLEWERPEDIHATAAAAIVAGKIIGWARNRAEFGPRALGARSILADPRPVENWQRINLAIKKRESFRPFAPAVLEEEAAERFELPEAACNLEQMNFVTPVRSAWRERLAAVTHVDGSARLQVVARQHNEDFWSLLANVRDLIGIGVLLNTSFNNRHEPIVDLPLDAVRTFLTTDLDLLVLGPYLVRKTAELRLTVSRARVRRAEASELVIGAGCNGTRKATLSRGSTAIDVSAQLVHWLTLPEDDWSVAEALSGEEPADRANLLDEVCRLWEFRLIDLVSWR